MNGTRQKKSLQLERVYYEVLLVFTVQKRLED